MPRKRLSPLTDRHMSQRVLLMANCFGSIDARLVLVYVLDIDKRTIIPPPPRAIVPCQITSTNKIPVRDIRCEIE